MLENINLNDVIPDFCLINIIHVIYNGIYSFINDMLLYVIIIFRVMKAIKKYVILPQYQVNGK